MILIRNRTTLAGVCLAWLLMAGVACLPPGAAHAQTIATTPIAGAVSSADGTPASGTVLISWPAFSNSSGNSVPAGSTSVALGAGGALNVNLVANANSTPMGSYYTVVYHLSDGSVTTEYWVVPVSSAPVAVNNIRSQVLPASVAMQTVSKSYVDTAIATAIGGLTPVAPTQAYVPASGGAMTGPLVLPGDPAAPLQASDKNYVDEQIATVIQRSGGTAQLPTYSSMMAQYLFTEGAGSVANDSSGSGNNATLGAGSLAPAWTPTGLAFTGAQNVALPAALNGARTMIFALYLNPLTGNAGHINQLGLLLTNTVGNTDLQVMLSSPYPGPPNNDFVDSAWGADIFSGGSVTAGSVTASGFHTLAITLGACGVSLDRIYFDGQEVQYNNQGCSAGKQTSGNLLLGGNPAAWGGVNGLPGQLYLAAFYSSVLTPAQIAAASGIARNLVATRGAVIAPAPVPLTFGALNVAGDSITYGYPNLTPYANLLTLENAPTVGVNNWGISGITLEAIAGSEVNRVGPLCHSASGPAVYTIFAGTNDFLNIPSATPASVFATLASDIQEMKTAGCRVGVVTMLSRAGNAANGATLDAEKLAYNALILTGARSAGADFIVDAAANPNLGANGAYADSTYFQADGVHPTQAGQQAIAVAYSNAYNYAFGHNKANPNVVPDASYQMLAGDGALSLASASAQAVTMPDCTGSSGAVYTLNNATGVSKTVTGGANQPINGQTSAIAIAPYSSLAIFDVPNPETVSGCHWEY